MSDRKDPMIDPDISHMDEDDGPSRRIRAPAIDFQPSMEPTAVMPSTDFRNMSVISTGQTKMVGARAAECPSKYVWKLKEIPELPELCPLERSAVFVPNSSPAEVAKRISDILHSRSIEASYNDTKAKVKCVTEDGVEFRVRLYRGRGKYSHGIIVEVQRRFGASNNFHNETTAILDAAQGWVPPEPLPKKGNLPLPPPVVSDDEDYEPDDGSSALKMVWTMLNGPKHDSSFLGLQTLMSLTDSAKIGAVTARNVSNGLMRLDSEVGSKVLSILTDRRGEDDTFKLRVMAMTVLANAMNNVTFVLPPVLKELLRPMLIQELKAAEDSPRLAVQAARCVECLLPNDDQVEDLHSALDVALKVGTVRHAGLERQAQKCIDKIPY